MEKLSIVHLRPVVTNYNINKRSVIDLSISYDLIRIQLSGIEKNFNSAVLESRYRFDIVNLKLDNIILYVDKSI